MRLADLDTLPPSEVAQLCGLTSTHGRGGQYATPCPACGAEMAHATRGERRGAVCIRSGWLCSQCHGDGGKGSRADLLALCLLRRRWASLSREERGALLDSVGGSAARPGPAWTAPAPRYLTGAEWEALVCASVPARQDERCRRWAAGRGLRLPAGALALPRTPVDGLPLVGSKGGWLPSAGYLLGLPMCDWTGRIVAMRIRRVWNGNGPKEVALPGYSSVGCVYAPWSVREQWLAGLPCSHPCLLVEGGPDWMAAGSAWHTERDVIGYVSGSMSGSPWARWLAQLHPDTILIPQSDDLSAEQRARGITEAAGQRYARLIREAAPWVREWRMSEIWMAAGVTWAMGRDLADLRRVGVALPNLGLARRQ